MNESAYLKQRREKNIIEKKRECAKAWKHERKWDVNANAHMLIVLGDKDNPYRERS